MYEGCGDVCDCSIMELLCLVRNAETGEFTFESVSYEYASSCSFTECLCNIIDGWSDATRPATGNNEPLPSPLLIPLPHYGDLVSLSNSPDDPQSVYYRNILQEITSVNAQRTDSAVNHPINQGKPDTLPVIGTSDEVPTIASNCPAETSVTCDLFYELDWSYRLSYTMPCEQAAEVDPCFATYACFCDNGYFRLAENMPEVPENVELDESAAEAINEAEAEVEEEKKEQEAE